MNTAQSTRAHMRGRRAGARESYFRQRPFNDQRPPFPLALSFCHYLFHSFSFSRALISLFILSNLLLP